jgi:hypothetical protein
MKYSTLLLSIVAVIAAGTVYAQNGGMEGPPDMPKIAKSASSAPHVPSKSSGRPKVVQPQR